MNTSNERSNMDPIPFDNGRFIIINNSELFCSQSKPVGGDPHGPASMGPLSDDKRVGRSIEMDLQKDAVVEVTISAQARGAFLYKVENKVKPTSGNVESISPVFVGMSRREIATEWDAVTFFGTGCWCTLMTSAVFQAPEAGKYSFGLLLSKPSGYVDNAGQFALQDLTMTIHAIGDKLPKSVALDESLTNLPPVK